jgi:cytosine/creatinine deaminase
MASYDILIKNAQLRSKPGELVDVAIKDGGIAAIENQSAGSALTEIDAAGNLVTESFVNTHLHLCKVYTLMMMDDEAMKAYHGGGDMGSAMTGIELAASVKAKYDESWIIKNARRAMAYSAIYGCNITRALADVDSQAKLEGVKAVIRAREEFKDIVDIQVTPFAQDGIVREPGTEDLMDQAMALGSDVVGGIPWIEYTAEDIAEHVKVIYDLAEKYDKPVSMLIDDAGDSTFRSLEVMAVESIKRGWNGRSLAHHCRAMSLYEKPYVEKICALLKKAEMGVVTDPHTGPLHVPVKDMLASGVLLCLGQDDISDAYYAYGRNNMLEVAFLSSHILWMTTRPEMEIMYDLVTTRAAQAVGVMDHKIDVGNPANIVVLDQPNVHEALRFHEAPAHVITNGKLVDQEKMWSIVRDMEW